MAESEKDGGIHPAVMHHIIDLHRKHSELALQMHDKQSEGADGMQEMHAAVTELTAAIKELIAVVKKDVKADGQSAEGK